MPATPKQQSADSLTCYTPTQNRQIAKALTELDYCREQLEINRQIIAKGHELHTQTAIQLDAAEAENTELMNQNNRLKKGRKWWFAGGVVTSLLTVMLVEH